MRWCAGYLGKVCEDRVRSRAWRRYFRPQNWSRSVEKLGARFLMRLTVAKDEVEDGHVERRVNALQVEQNCGRQARCSQRQTKARQEYSRSECEGESETQAKMGTCEMKAGATV